LKRLQPKSNIDLDGVEFVETGDDPMPLPQKSAELCREGSTNVIMKGSLHTDELLGTVVSKEGGLRTSRRMSHVFVFDLPDSRRLLLMADCVININPGLIEKRDIVQNAVDVAHALNIERPYVAILSAVEMINPSIPGTIDAAALCKMAERGQITGAVVDGPLGYDIAISIEAARIKGINWPHAERPDILIMPNLEAGNMLVQADGICRQGGMRRHRPGHQGTDSGYQPC
jgi:phosphate acetyltransferase